jgi:acetyl-CoA/propionyl-CoA carboxylase biotin carboxyl carrier protein
VCTGQQVRDVAADCGYPVAVKASYGGGGRGMRVVRSGAEADSAVDAAQREAQAYFGRPEVYVERYLDRPRHVEVQILADAHGSVVALGTRDCSVQRRHQKLLEEAPATVVSPATTAAMEAASCSLAASVGYRGAGTLEFLVQDDEFYFLEMNTRLQVEHPVTEAVTGIDLVAEQIRIAAGLPISIKQSDVRISGHAIELRINAEDPHSGGFLPAPGDITDLTVPHQPDVRFDTGYEPGDRVSEHYDGLVGKLVVWAEDRASAITRARRVLRESHVGGIKTTAAAHELVLAHPDFVDDRHTTRWLETDTSLAERLGTIVTDDDETGLPPRRLASVNGRRFWLPYAGGGQPPRALLQRNSAGLMQGASDGLVRAPMQGVVVKIDVTVGDTVDSSDVVCVLEAMKMENSLPGGRSGRVVEIAVSEGQGVSPGAVLLTIE